MAILSTLLSVYQILITGNLIFSAILFYYNPKRLYGLLAFTWFATLVNIGLQHYFIALDYYTTLAFSTYFFAALCLSAILAKLSDLQLDFRKFFLIYLLGLLTGFVLYREGYGFFFYSLPPSIAIAYPQLHTAVKKLFLAYDKGGKLSNLFVLLLIINGLHFLDYPFLRGMETFAIYSYSLVIILSGLFGALLVYLIHEYHASLIRNELLGEVKLRKDTEEQLQASLKKAEKLSKIKSAFLANMSHEIRTPLNGIIGFNQLLAETPLNSEQKNFLDHVRLSSNNLLEIVNNVLNLTQLEYGDIPVTEREFFPTRMLDELKSHYANTCTRETGLFFKADDSLPEVLISDRGKILQILFNLINNAIKYSEASTIKVSLHFKPVDHRKGLLVLTVDDNGIGIDNAYLKDILQPYVQLNLSSEGIGLGLSITRQLTGILDGQFHFNTRLGEGCKVSSEIPVRIGKLSGMTTSRTSSNENQGTVVSKVDEETYRDKYILVIEDNPVNQLIMKNLLDKHGIPYDVAASAIEARQYLDSRIPDLVFMDVQLPDESGLDLTRAIKQEHPELPVIILSAFTFDEDKLAGIKAGADEYLRKPVQLDVIRAVLQKHLTLTNIPVH